MTNLAAYQIRHVQKKDCNFNQNYSKTEPNTVSISQKCIATVHNGAFVNQQPSTADQTTKLDANASNKQFLRNSANTFISQSDAEGTFDHKNSNIVLRDCSDAAVAIAFSRGATSNSGI